MRYVESINQALRRLLADTEDVYILGEDIADPYGGAFKATRGLSSEFPHRVLGTPISEAGICGLALGMSMRGLRPVLEIMFGDFITLCCDQLVNGAAKFQWMYNDKVRTPLVVRTPMGGRRGYGPTHSQTLESLFFNVPMLTVVAPSHCHDPGELLEKAVLLDNGPVVFVENKKLYPMRISPRSPVGHFRGRTVSSEDILYPSRLYSLAPGDAPAATLLAYGGMAPLALEAAREVFAREEIVLEVLVPSCVKPLPEADIISSVIRSGRAVVVEESPLCWGWGAEVAAVLQAALFGRLKAPVERVGAKPSPIPAARVLEDGVLPQPSNVVEAVRKAVRG